MDLQTGDSTSALLAASTALLERLNAAESPLSIVSESLADLASTLGAGGEARVFLVSPDGEPDGEVVAAALIERMMVALVTI